MRIVRFLPIAAITLATGLWFGGTAFAGGAFGSAIPRVDSNPFSVETVKPVHSKKRQFRRHNRKRQFRSQRRDRRSFSFGFGYSPYNSYRPYYRGYSGYGYNRPYGYYRPHFNYRHY